MYALILPTIKIFFEKPSFHLTYGLYMLGLCILVKLDLLRKSVKGATSSSSL